MIMKIRFIRLLLVLSLILITRVDGFSQDARGEKVYFAVEIQGKTIGRYRPHLSMKLSLPYLYAVQTRFIGQREPVNLSGYAELE